MLSALFHPNMDHHATLAESRCSKHLPASVKTSFHFLSFLTILECFGVVLISGDEKVPKPLAG